MINITNKILSLNFGYCLVLGFGLDFGLNLGWYQLSRLPCPFLTLKLRHDDEENKGNERKERNKHSNKGSKRKERNKHRNKGSKRKKETQEQRQQKKRITFFLFFLNWRNINVFTKLVQREKNPNLKDRISDEKPLKDSTTKKVF